MAQFKISLKLLLVILSGLILPANAQVKITDGADTTMNTNSLLELESSNKGILIPRVALSDLSLPDPLTAPIPVGMMVFSSGGTVYDGFYYWDGTSWGRILSTGTNILRTYTRTSDASLTKTDNIIFASNDITLILPQVTSADTGLVISIKNVGSPTIILP